MAATGRMETPAGVELHYEVHGSGEPVILLHGFGGAGSDWAPLAPEWAIDFQVIVPDLPGHGSSRNPLPVFRHDGAADAVTALLDHLGVELSEDWESAEEEMSCCIWLRGSRIG